MADKPKSAQVDILAVPAEVVLDTSKADRKLESFKSRAEVPIEASFDSKRAERYLSSFINNAETKLKRLFMKKNNNPMGISFNEMEDGIKTSAALYASVLKDMENQTQSAATTIRKELVDQMESEFSNLKINIGGMEISGLENILEEVLHGVGHIEKIDLGVRDIKLVSSAARELAETTEEIAANEEKITQELSKQEKKDLWKKLNTFTGKIKRNLSSLGTSDMREVLGIIDKLKDTEEYAAKIQETFGNIAASFLNVGKVSGLDEVLSEFKESASALRNVDWGFGKLYEKGQLLEEHKALISELKELGPWATASSAATNWESKRNIFGGMIEDPDELERSIDLLEQLRTNMEQFAKLTKSTRFQLFDDSIYKPDNVFSTINTTINERKRRLEELRPASVDDYDVPSGEELAHKFNMHVDTILDRRSISAQLKEDIEWYENELLQGRTNLEDAVNNLDKDIKIDAFRTTFAGVELPASIKSEFDKLVVAIRNDEASVEEAVQSINSALQSLEPVTDYSDYGGYDDIDEVFEKEQVREYNALIEECTNLTGELSDAVAKHAKVHREMVSLWAAGEGVPNGLLEARETIEGIISNYFVRDLSEPTLSTDGILQWLQSAEAAAMSVEALVADMESKFEQAAVIEVQQRLDADAANNMVKLQDTIQTLKQRYGEQSFNNIFGNVFSSFDQINAKNALSIYDSLIAKEQEYLTQKEEEERILNRRRAEGKKFYDATAYIYDSAPSTDVLNIWNDYWEKISKGALNAEDAIRQFGEAFKQIQLPAESDPTKQLEDAYDAARQNVTKLREQLAGAKQEQERLLNHANVYGYTLDMSAQKAGRIQSVLAKSGKQWNGPRSEAIPYMLSQGYVPEKYSDDYGLGLPMSASYIPITKTEYEYAQYLIQAIDKLNVGWDRGLKLLKDQNGQLENAQTNVVRLEASLAEAMEVSDAAYEKLSYAHSGFFGDEAIADDKRKRIEKSRQEKHQAVVEDNSTILQKEALADVRDEMANIDVAARGAQKSIEGQGKAAREASKAISEQAEDALSAAEADVINLKETEEALKLLRDAEERTKTRYDFSDVFDTEALRAKLTEFSKVVADDAGLKIGSISVSTGKDGVDTASVEYYNEEMKVAIRQTYQLKEGMLQLGNTKYSQNIKSLQADTFDVEGYQKRATASVDKVRSTLNGLKYDLSELDTMAQSITSKSDWDKFNNHLKAAQDSISALRQGTTTKSSMNPLANMRRDMQNASFEIETMQTNLKKFGNIEGVDGARKSIENMTKAAKEFNDATTAEGQQKAFNTYSDERSKYNAQIKLLEAVERQQKRELAASKKESTTSFGVIQDQEIQNLEKYLGSLKSFEYLSDSLKEKAEELRFSLEAATNVEQVKAWKSEFEEFQNVVNTQQESIPVRLEVEKTKGSLDASRKDLESTFSGIGIDVNAENLSEEQAKIVADYQRLTLIAKEYSKEVGNTSRENIQALQEESRALKDRMQIYADSRSQVSSIVSGAADSIVNVGVNVDVTDTSSLTTSQQELLGLYQTIEAQGNELIAQNRAVTQSELESLEVTKLALEAKVNSYAKQQDEEKLRAQKASLIENISKWESDAKRAGTLSQQTIDNINALKESINNLGDIGGLDNLATQFGNLKQHTSEQTAAFKELVSLTKSLNTADLGFYRNMDNPDIRDSYTKQIESYNTRIDSIRSNTTFSDEQELELQKIQNEHLQKKLALLGQIEAKEQQSQTAIEQQTSAINAQVESWKSSGAFTNAFSQDLQQEILAIQQSLSGLNQNSDLSQLTKAWDDVIAKTNAAIQKKQEYDNAYYKNEFQNNYVYSGGKTASDQIVLDQMGDMYKSQEVQIETDVKQLNERIKSIYNELLNTVNKINNLDVKLQNTKLQDAGSGLYAGAIDAMERQREELLFNLQLTAEKIQSELGESFVQNESIFNLPTTKILQDSDGLNTFSNVASFFGDLRTQSALTSQEIEKFSSALEKSQDIALNFTGKLTSEFQEAFNVATKLGQLTAEGKLSQTSTASIEAFSKYEAFKDYKNALPSDMTKWSSEQIAMVRLLNEEFVKYGNSVAQAAQKESQYFSSKQATSLGTTISQFDQVASSADTMGTKLNANKASLEQFVKKFSDGKAVITGFTQSADGISKINFSVFNEGTAQLRTFSAEMGKFTSNIYTTETSMNSLSAGTTAAQKSISSISELLLRLQSMKDSDISVDNSYIAKLQEQALKLQTAMEAAQGSNDVGKQTALKNMAADANKAVKEVNNLVKSYENLNAQIGSGSVEKLGVGDVSGDARTQLINEIVKSAPKATVAIGDFDAKTNTLTYTLTSADRTVTTMKASMDSLTGTMTTQAVKVGKNASAWQELTAGMSGQITRYANYAFSIHRVISTMRQGFTYVKEIDTALTELKKVTDESEASYARFLQTASGTAGEIGSTVKEFTNATADFARLGYDIEGAAELAEAASVYANVGDDVESITQSSESIISTMKAFGIEAENAMGIVDRFNEIGNNFAISSGGIGEALTRSASALAAGGNSLDESIALITASNTIVQNVETVGTSLKTLSLRLRGAKVELEDAGLETDGMADSVSTLREKLLALTGNKVDIMIDENTFKSTTQILREMSEVWDEMTDINQANCCLYVQKCA